MTIRIYAVVDVDHLFGVFILPLFRAIARAVRALEQPNINVSDAVDVRQELDLRIGGYSLLIN